jgi:hypothetical protein
MPGIRNHKGSSAMLITYLRDKCMASEEYYDNFFSHDGIRLPQSVTYLPFDSLKFQCLELPVD